MEIRKGLVKELVIYTPLAVLLVFPLLKVGYIQTFDMPWGPVTTSTRPGNNFWLLFQVIKGLSFIISSMLVQKLLILAIFILAGIGAHKFVQKHITKSSLAAYAAGIFYMFNPFIYTRLMAGQWLVLLGYALLPWAVSALWQLMQKPSLKPAIKATLWTAAIGLTSIHAVGFVALAGLALFLAAGKNDIKPRLKWCAATVSAWIVINALWLIPLLLGKSTNAMQIGSFGSSQLEAFASTGTVLGSTPLSTLLLQGFWADPQGRYYLPSHLGWWWGIVVVLLAGLIIAGAIKVIRQKDRLGIALIILAIIAWWLAMGVGSSWSAGTTHWLVAHVPLYRGYREPQKWLMLLALAYAYLLAVGTAQLASWLKQRKPTLEAPAAYAVMFLPILLVPMLLWGAGGQLKASRYPADWSQAASILNKDTSDYKVLVLPWHIYLPVSFVGRVVANPAPHYFKQDLVISDNLELAGVPPTQSSALYKQIDNYLLPQAPYRSDAAKQLAPYHVKYVILLHEADWQRYTWLPKQTGLTAVQKGQTISLYRNMEVR